MWGVGFEIQGVGFGQDRHRGAGQLFFPIIHYESGKMLVNIYYEPGESFIYYESGESFAIIYYESGISVPRRRRTAGRCPRRSRRTAGNLSGVYGFGFWAQPSEYGIEGLGFGISGVGF